MFRKTSIQEVVRFIPWMAAGVLAATLAGYASLALRFPSVSEQEGSAGPALAWPDPPAIDESAWSVFAPGQSRVPVDAGPLSRRFRLAGTFFSFGEPGEGVGAESVCKAILDDLENNAQHLLGEGEVLNGVQVAQIYRDHIVLRNNGREEELWLSFSKVSKDATSERPASGDLDRDAPPLETSRFGKRIGEHRWVLDRDALMAYYDELRDDPERIGHIYTSMWADIKDNEVAGYQLRMAGEQDFFKATGLLEGDIVRKVNSLQITSQARAEYFIGEFLQGRLSAVVVDVEREGAPEKLIYLIR